MTASHACDVLVVGARCAGAALAIELCRSTDLRVCVVDRSTFPSDTLSTHICHDAAPLADLVGYDTLTSTDAPPILTTSWILDGRTSTVDHGHSPGICVRRLKLDQLLVSATTASGADVLTGAEVVELTWKSGRVSGAIVRRGPDVLRLSARVVVGADGRGSAVARCAGAQERTSQSFERAGVWGYFSGASAPRHVLRMAFLGGEIFVGTFTDSGLYLVASITEVAKLPMYRSAGVTGFGQLATQLGELGHTLRTASMESRLFRMPRGRSFIRTGAGPGWVLVGDASHFKDPTPGQGMVDAIEHGRSLAKYLGQCDDLGDVHSLATWSSGRDVNLRESYWLAGELGRAGPMTPILARLIGAGPEVEIAGSRLREIVATGGSGMITDDDIECAGEASVAAGEMSPADARAEVARMLESRATVWAATQPLLPTLNNWRQPDGA